MYSVPLMHEAVVFDLRSTCLSSVQIHPYITYTCTFAYTNTLYKYKLKLRSLHLDPTNKNTNVMLKRSHHVESKFS